MNRALQLFDNVEIACFGTAGKVMDTVGYHDRAKRLMPLFHADAVDAPQAMEILTATGRLERPPWPIPVPVKEPKGPNREQVWREHIAAGHPLGRASIGVIQLVTLGYDEFWLFGHDGGHDRVDALKIEPSRRGYDKARFCLEEQLQQLGVRYAFWPAQGAIT